MTLYLCTRSALTSHICRTALAGKVPFSSIPDLDVHTITGLSALADGILLDGSEFSREELGIIFTKADRQCRMVLLAESPLMEACMQEFRERACCLNILAPSGELQKKLAALFDGGRAGRKKGRQETDRAAMVPAQAGPTDPLSRYRRKSFMDRVRFVAQTNADVLLLGESGAGKSWLAEKIYRYSGHRGNFLSESLANISPNLFESELFGTASGAYTGSVSRMGLLEAAGEGTLFLDEIGELPLQLQSKLFATLDRRTFRRMGSLKEQPFKGRLIFATNKNLEEAVREGSFREELFNRISTVTLSVPPLREHPHDIPDLAAQFARDEGKTISAGALERLCRHRYPGNIRELKNIVRRSCLLSRRKVLERDDIYF